MTTTTYAVTGMSCEHCVNAVTTELGSLPAQVQPGRRVVLASMVPVGHSIAEPEDAGVLNIAGMDAALPIVVTEFIR